MGAAKILFSWQDIGVFYDNFNPVRLINEKNIIFRPVFGETG
jgi:hypothetical protein